MHDPLIPATVQELLRMVEKYAGQYVLIAGGTDIMLKLPIQIRPDIRLIDLSGIAQMRVISATNEEISIGALNSMSQLSESRLLNRRAVSLAQAASRLGSWQIRSRATLGGNIINASPAADTPVALAALNAKAVLLSPKGRRELAVEEIPLAPNLSCLEPGEILTQFKLPLIQSSISAFAKTGSRSEVSIARLNLAVSGQKKCDGSLDNPRVFLGTLGRAAINAPVAEECLRQKGLEDSEAFGLALADKIGEAIKGRSTLAYKQSAAMALAQDILVDLKSQFERREVAS